MSKFWPPWWVKTKDEQVHQQCSDARREDDPGSVNLALRNDLDPDQQGWPSGSTTEASTTVFDAQVDVRKKRVDAEIARTAARYAADLDDLGRFSTAYAEIASGAIERARAGAEAVIKASAALVALYTGVLGLTFSVSDNPLPPRGLLAPIFLGLAVVLATAYLGFLRPQDESVPAPSRTQTRPVENNVLARGGVLVSVTQAIVRRLSWCLRGSVLALGVGLAYLPMPFLALGSGAASSPKIDWPAAVVGNGEQLDLVKLRYAEQLKEVATQRASGLGPDPTTEVILIIVCVLVGAGVVAGGTLLSGQNLRKKGK